jgi:RNA polymerase sigma-70 factor (ECF subfamily)
MLMSESGPDGLKTHGSIFLRLKATDPRPREMAWSEFRQRYAPVIAGFARKLAVRPQDVDDVIQDVFLGFFAVSPRFVYDPSKGRFRGYLKTVTLNSIRARFERDARINTVPISEVSDNADPVEHTWEQSWREQLLRRALQQVRDESSAHPKTFEAFDRYVLKNEPAADVAESLEVSVDVVYQAKHRISEALKLKIAALEQEED